VRTGERRGSSLACTTTSFIVQEIPSAAEQAAKSVSIALVIRW